MRIIGTSNIPKNNKKLYNAPSYYIASLPDCLLTVKIFYRDLVINFSGLTITHRFMSRPERELIKEKRRGAIRKFSRRSSKRLRFLVRNTANMWKSMITLTYPAEYPSDGKTVKKHLNVFLNYLRRKKIKYVWVLEFQERGAPHFHILTDSDDILSLDNKAVISKRWFDIVGSGDPRHLAAGTRVDVIVSEDELLRYLSSYATKLLQKTPPPGYENVGRFWGASRGLLYFSYIQVLKCYEDASRHLRLLNRWYKALLRSWGIKWRWRGVGYTCWEGVRFYKYLTSLLSA